jgi:hypothetical protein
MTTVGSDFWPSTVSGCRLATVSSRHGHRIAGVESSVHYGGPRTDLKPVAPLLTRSNAPWCLARPWAHAAQVHKAASPQVRCAASAVRVTTNCGTRGTFASSCCCASWDTAAWASRHVPIRPGPVDIAGDALPATSTVFDLGLVWWWCRRTPGIARGRPSGTARSRPRRNGASPRVGRGPSFDRDGQGQFAVAISTAVEGRVQSGECVPMSPASGMGPP